VPLTTSTAANSICEAYAPGFEQAVFRNDSLMGLFSWTPAVGDTAYRWKLNSAGNNSVEVFTEGQGQPIAGNQTFVNAAVDWTYHRGMLQFTGHALDALKSNWIPQADEEARLLMEDLKDLMTTGFMGSTYGLELAVDYGSSYAGITRNGSAGYFESTETAVSGALSTDDLLDLRETIRDNDKAGRPKKIICAENQSTNVYRLGGPHVIYNGQPGEKAPGIGSQTFAGMPIIALPDWSDTVIMMIDDGGDNFVGKEIRPFSVKDMGPSGDSDVFQLSWGGQLVCKQPRFQGKLTGVTA